MSEEAFAKQFLHGSIYFNSLSYFWGDEDSYPAGQMDSYEGTVCNLDARGENDCKRDSSYGYCNIMCCYNYLIDGNVQHHENKHSMKEFGDYAIIIKDPDSFLARIVEAATREELKCAAGLVRYQDNSLELFGCFDKIGKLSYQNEWRTVLFRDDRASDSIRLEIGSIEDIAELVFTADLPDRINQIVEMHDYEESQKDVFGNVTKDEIEIAIRSGKAE